MFTNLFIAKTKEAAVKTPSMPRLELCEAHLLSRLIRNIWKQTIMENRKFHLWTDSTIVLAWLRKTPGTWKTFVANQVAMILENVRSSNWTRVVSQDNPADLATRGLNTKEFHH